MQTVVKVELDGMRRSLMSRAQDSSSESLTKVDRLNARSTASTDTVEEIVGDSVEMTSDEIELER